MSREFSTFRISDLQLVITRKGKVSVFAKAGVFGEAKEKIERLLSDLGLEGIKLERKT